MSIRRATGCRTRITFKRLAVGGKRLGRQFTQRGTGNRMIGWGLSLGRADRLGQPRLSEGA